MKKLALLGALMLASALGLGACSTAQQTAVDSQMAAATQNLVALDNALITVNNTLVGNAIAQAKLLAPYQCGAYALASAILSNSSAATKVNAFIAENVAANVSSVAVKDVCAAVGYPTNVAAAPAASATPTAVSK
jgi:hypothetical protein